MTIFEFGFFSFEKGSNSLFDHQTRGHDGPGKTYSAQAPVARHTARHWQSDSHGSTAPLVVSSFLCSSSALP